MWYKTVFIQYKRPTSPINVFLCHVGLTAAMKCLLKPCGTQHYCDIFPVISTVSDTLLVLKQLTSASNSSWSGCQNIWILSKQLDLHVPFLKSFITLFWHEDRGFFKWKTCLTKSQDLKDCFLWENVMVIYGIAWWFQMSISEKELII